MRVSEESADSVIAPFHYGTTYEMAGYTTNAHTFYLSAAYQPIAKMRLTSTLTYNLSKAGFEEGIMPDGRAFYDGDRVLEHMDFSFAEMDAYSDLDFEILRFAAGVEYQFTPTFTFTLDGDVAHVVDYQGWVWGDETGRYYMVRSGVLVNF
ncbi:MAG TPA: hypothetical protein PLR32_04770 [candidate division Zixibacteria bacterium]|nr:hypothetical protein [candidate division Zixibacteria bacterium]MDD4917563.1 hypothetical protein [candidate division Zixibacteria bacterium]MDM7972168.1 hypothetical protein [candidate division Zixibacteria bacterium]HOD66464.1 hypothetical protein [candidate division Zixibacteria bacterium]HOZ06762.1 hypothetical protein [candidate division Zixibacteria bacterium]